MTTTDTTGAALGVVPSDRLSGLGPYEPPAPSPLIDLALDANEGGAPLESVMAAMRSVTPDELRRYPDAGLLESRIADLWGIDPERVVVTNGGDDAIDRVCRAVLEPGRELLVHTPTFEMIGRSGRLAGGLVRQIEWLNGAFPIREFLGSISGATSLVALVSPNNPTGGVIGSDMILDVVRAARRQGIAVVVDLAYAEFADADPTPELLNEPNVVIVRTFSKAMGLAGARLGYAIASPEMARWLRTVGGPYPVSSCSIAMGTACLGAAGERALFIREVRRERAELVQLLLELGCEVFESEANFVLASFTDAGFVGDALRSLGIGVRSYTRHSLISGCLRITLPGDERQYERLALALRTILRPEAVLLDLGLVDSDADTLRRFADRLKLGFVTGRPRAEAESFLDRQGLRDLVSVLVCSDDARASTPHERVRLALEGLGVGQAWLAGGTPDDMVAARSNRVLPIGVAVTDNDIPASADALRAAGAGAVVNGLGELERIMP